MSNLVIANSQKHKILEGGRDFLNSLEMRLGTVEVALSGTVMPTHPDDECTDGGYTSVVNPFPNAAAVDGTRAKATGVNPTFVFDHDDGDFTIHNVYFTDPNDSDVVVMAQDVDSPFTVVAAGQVFVVQAAFYFDTLD